MTLGSLLSVVQLQSRFYINNALLVGQSQLNHKPCTLFSLEHASDNFWGVSFYLIKINLKIGLTSP
jgi:hypothetical protein